MPNPTPTELALIAAALGKSGDPNSKLPEALELWKNANRLLVHAANQAWLESIGPRQQEPRISLNERLAQLMPDITEPTRKKVFHEYLREKIWKSQKNFEAASDGYQADESKLESITRDNEEVMKAEGVSPKAFDDLPQWRQSRKSANKAESGRTGGKNKAAKIKAAAEAKKRKLMIPKLEFHPDEAVLDFLAQQRLPD